MKNQSGTQIIKTIFVGLYLIFTESLSQIHNCINVFISRRITIWLDRDLLRIVTILANFHEYSRIQNVKFYLHKWKITYLHT